MSAQDRDGGAPTLAPTVVWQPADSDEEKTSRAEPLPHPLRPGDSIGPFELLDFIGRGGMGQVYKARDTRLDRVLALKLLLHNRPELEQRFQREAWAQAKIDHSGVCKVFEVGSAGEWTYIAMEFLEGETLAEVAEDLTLEEMVSVMHQVAEAIHAAHRQALVHRDLKPSNIMVQRRDGMLKAWVLDFGLVLAVDDAQLTRTGDIIGTPLYMAPEQLLGDAAAIDRRTDIYSLGAILYEWTTGRPPITGKTTLDLLRRIGSEDPEPPRQLRPSLPADLEWIILQCLEKEPGHRYSSAAALMRDLGRFRSGDPVEARRSTWGYRWTKRFRKHRRLLIAASLLFALVASVVWRDLAQQRDAAKAARLTALFLSKVAQIEWQTRLIGALPPHDTRPGKDEMVAELEALEAEVEAAGRVAKGPGLFALGRGYHVLGDLDRGLRYLELAWQAGNRDPILSFDLGLAYGEKYDEALLHSRQAADPDVRERLEREAEATFKTSALEHFGRARLADVGSSAWAQGLIAIYEERWETALEALDRAEMDAPWRYEVHTQRSKVWRERAETAAGEDRFEDAQDFLARAVEALAVARRMGESDPKVYAALCHTFGTRMNISDELVGTSHEGRRELLEPCLQAIRVDSESLNALIAAASMAERIAIRLMWTGDGEAQAYFERSRDWAQRAVDIDPESVPAINLWTRSFTNLGFLSESAEERERLLAEALEGARRATEIAPDDLESMLLLVDITSAIAGYTSQQGADVEPLFRQAAAVLEPFVRHPSPLASVLARHASFESQRADWYLGRGGDAEGALARAKASFGAIESDHPMDEFTLWIQAELCTTEAAIVASKGESSADLAACRKMVAERAAATPDDLEWAIAEAVLLLIVLQVDPAELPEIEPRLETVLRKLAQSDLHREVFYDRFLAQWRSQRARFADESERPALLIEAIDAYTRSVPLSHNLMDRLAKANAQLHLAELERRRARPEAAQRLLEESRRELSEVKNQDAKLTHAWLLEAVADHIETTLKPTEGSLKTPTHPELDTHISWDTLQARRHLRSEIRWWRSFLEGRDG